MLRVAEVGSCIGASAVALGLAAAGERDARLPCADAWHNWRMSAEAHGTMAQFLRDLAWLGSNLSAVRDRTAGGVDDVPGRPGQFDFSFVDGDDSYAGCSAKGCRNAPLMVAVGIVAFLDLGWAEGVRRVVHRELLTRVTLQSRLRSAWKGQLA